jgi:predicted deacylase
MRHVWMTLLIGWTGIASAQQADRQSFTVGTAVAQPGTTATGVIAVPAGSDSAIDIPVAVMHGKRPGPVVALIAGSHGTEYATSIAMQRLIARIDATNLAGTVIIVPILSIRSFTSLTARVNPVDGKYMVYGYPGDINGTQSQRAEALVTEAVIAPADVVIDFHGGDLDEDLRLSYIGWPRSGRAAQDSSSRVLVDAFGLEGVALFDRNLDAPNAGSTIAGQAMVRGKAVILMAGGRVGLVTPGDIATVVNGSLNVLDALHMLAHPHRTVTHHFWMDASAAKLVADQPGVFFPAGVRDMHVKKGQLLGYTTDFLGQHRVDLTSPFDGVLVYDHGVPSVEKGTVLAEVLPVLKALPAWRDPRQAH